MESIKRKVRVIVTKEIEVELMPSVFGDMSEHEYLYAFNQSFWEVNGIDDVVKYAAEVSATNGAGYNHDGLGLVDKHYTSYPKIPDVKFKELYEEIESEFID